MPVIKLDAIPSTNDFLKELSQSTQVNHFTVVTAEHQTGGRGQMGSQWLSQQGKNLTFSVFVKNAARIDDIYTLNVAAALSAITALSEFRVPSLSIKWPNDIMSGNKKIGGILIENSIKGDGSINAIIGIGINVNQRNFELLPKASSLANVLGYDLDRDAVLNAILNQLEERILMLGATRSQLWKDYQQHLYKMGVPTAFEDKHGQFMGIIQNVTRDGKLQLLVDDRSLKTFELKQIQMLY